VYPARKTGEVARTAGRGWIDCRWTNPQTNLVEAKSTYVERLGSARLRQIIRRGDRIDLQMVACACPPGTEGTQQCNSGWPCGRLTPDSKSPSSSPMITSARRRHPGCGESGACIRLWPILLKRMSWCGFETPEQGVNRSIGSPNTGPIGRLLACRARSEKGASAR
jgi:hypothetical protein